jgi:hypothetical protein
MFQFEFINDLNLKDDMIYLTPNSPILILLGNIGHYSNTTWKMFMDDISKKWKIIMYVLGDKEYYHYNRAYTDIHFQYKIYLSQYSNIYLLDTNKPSLSINDVNIFGATMWTHMENTISNISKISNIKERKCIPEFESEYHILLNIKIENEIKKLEKSLDEYFDTISLSPITWNMMHEYDTALLLDFINKRKHINIITTHFPILENVYKTVLKYINPEIDVEHSILELSELYPLDIETMNLGNPTYIFISGHTLEIFTYAFEIDNMNFVFLSNGNSLCHVEI